MNTSTNMTDAEIKEQTIICNLISQRTRFLSLLTPSPRYTPISPYPTYTKEQLDMRRKAEVLQYKKNSTQVYQTKKTQKWSQIVNATTNRYIPCNKSPYVVSLSSACDVPGPLTSLYYDPSIPLYNYATKQNAYASFYTTPEFTWEFKKNVDISGGNMLAANVHFIVFQEGGTEHKLITNFPTGTIIMQNIKELQLTYKYTIPIGLFVYGKTIGTPSMTLENIKITEAILNIFFYNEDNINNASSNPFLSIPITNSFTNTNILDLSMSFVPTVTDGIFNCSQYIGDIIVPNITLNTSYGFIYDFKLHFELSYSPLNNSTISNNDLTFGVYINMPPYDISSNGCIVTPQTPSLLSKYLPFSVVQT